MARDLTTWQLNNPKVEIDSLRRLAKWLGLKRDIDVMSKRQLVRLIRWLITRRDKRERGWIP
jgi:hypothetical protein